MVPSFTDLTYFYEIADSLNFSHAAKKLGVSQPSLSMAIGRLERLLNVVLFIRHRQGVTLTPPGERLFNHVSELLEKWQETESSIQLLNQVVRGKVTLGCHATLVSQITNVITGLLEAYPSLEIQILNDISFNTTQGVIDGSLDVGIVVDPIKHPDLVMHKIKTVEISYWINIEANGDPAVVIYDPQSIQVQFLLREYEKQQKISRLCAINNLEMIAELTEKGVGVGILPACFVNLKYETRLKRLTHAPIYQSEMYLIHRSENRKMLAREAVLSAIKKIIVKC